MNLLRDTYAGMSTEERIAAWLRDHGFTEIADSMDWPSRKFLKGQAVVQFWHAPDHPDLIVAESFNPDDTEPSPEGALLPGVRTTPSCSIEWLEKVQG